MGLISNAIWRNLFCDLRKFPNLARINFGDHPVIFEEEKGYFWGNGDSSERKLDLARFNIGESDF